MEVQLPDGTIAEFPDDMPHEQIQGVLQQQFPSQSTSSAEPEQNFLQRLPRNIMAGLAKGGRSTAQLLPQGIKSLEDLGKMMQGAMGQLPGAQMEQPEGAPISQQVQSGIDQLMPPDFDYDKAVGISGERGLMDRLLSGAAEHAPELVGAAGIAKAGLPYVSKRIAARPYGQAEKMLKEAGVTKIEPPKELISDAKQYFKDNAANRALIEKAESGDIVALFKLQSDLGKKSAGYARSPLSFAERDFGKEGFKTREAMLQHKQQQLEQMGMKDAADLLEKGRKQFKGYHDFKPYKYILGGAALSQTPVPSYLAKLMLHK